MGAQPKHLRQLTLLILALFLVVPGSASRAADAEQRQLAFAAGPAPAASDILRGKYYAQNHDGQKKDYRAAMTWFRKAAAGGDIEAYYLIGEYYEDGRGVAQDYSKARNWYCAAAMRGNPEAQAALGGFYEHGLGVSKDLEQAYYWFGLAAMSGNEDYIRERDHAAHRLSSRQAKYIRRYLGLWQPAHLTATTVFGGCPLPSDGLPG